MCAGQGIASKKAMKGILIVTSIMLFSFNFVYYLEKEAVVAYCGELRTSGDPAIGNTYTHELSAKRVNKIFFKCFLFHVIYIFKLHSM